MGSEAVWVPLVMAAVAGGTSYYNSEQTAKKQDNTLADQIRAQGKRNQQADALVNDALLKQGQSNPDDERSSSLDKYLTQLQRTHGQAVGGLQQLGGVSNRYATEAQDAANDVAKYSANTADLMSRIDAPILQRQNEGIAFGRLGADLGTVGMLSDSDRYLGDIRMRGVRRDPWLDALSSAAAAYGSSYGAGGASGGTGGSTAFGYGSF